jgi:2-oxoglutarate ferredoxin oxidoreductase subunit beta
MESTLEIQRTVKDYRSDQKPTWCPGCGDFAVLNALYKAMATRNLDPKDVVVVSGIGCSSRLPEFVATYGLHVVHGRALPTAMGVKTANPELTVIAVGGDGDGFAIGGGHVPHAVRRNVDITYIVMDNEVYGLTKGQPSPTTPAGMQAVQHSSSMPKMAPWGIVETPLNMMAMVLTYGAAFAARGFSGKPNEMAELIGLGIDHRGFSFIQAMSPCVTFYDTYADWKTLVAPIPESHDAADRFAAIQLALTEKVFHCGIFVDQTRPALHELTQNIVDRNLIPDRKTAIASILDGFA